MKYWHLARCPAYCSLIWLILQHNPVARDLLRICGACARLRPIRKEKK